MVWQLHHRKSFLEHIVSEFKKHVPRLLLGLDAVPEHQVLGTVLGLEKKEKDMRGGREKRARILLACKTFG